MEQPMLPCTRPVFLLLVYSRTGACARIHHGGLVPEFRPLAVVQVLARAVFDHNLRQWRRGAKPYSCSWKLNPEISPGGYFAFAYLAHPMINYFPHDGEEEAAKPLFLC